MTTRTLVGTGASSGLGFEAIRQLLTASTPTTKYRVLPGCRDTSAARNAYTSAGLLASHHKFEFLPLELGNLASVKTFADAVLQSLEETKTNLDTLLLCAAIWKAPSSTARGEAHKTSKRSEALIVNYAAQQYLLHLLEAKIRSSHTRVVLVTSMLYKGINDTNTLEDLVDDNSTASAAQVYKATKFIQLASLLKWREKLGDSAEIIAVSPGFVPSTGLSRETGYLANLGMKYIMPWAPFATTLEQGGQAIVRAFGISLQENMMLLDKNGKWEELTEDVSEPAVVDKWWWSRENIEALAGPTE